MIVVLDASAAAEIVFGRRQGPALATLLGTAQVVLAPDLYVAEMTNTVWKVRTLAGVPHEVCQAALRRALQLPDRLVGGRELFEEVYSVACRHQHPAYDLFYAVLARRHDAKLATLDRKLARLCQVLGVDCAPL